MAEHASTWHIGQERPDGQDDYFVAGERRVMAAAVAVTVPDVAPLEQRRLF